MKDTTREELIQQLNDARHSLPGLTATDVAPYFGEAYVKNLDEDELRRAVDLLRALVIRLSSIDESDP